uniref:Large ribosomal subunit protein bL32m n=1 Tax=Cannabis sativa TaxID=3483 RepID=A0A803PQT3_CANSA
MAFRMLMLRSAGGKISSLLGLRWSHGAAIPGPLDGLIDRNVISPQMVLPEASLEDSYNNKNIGFGFPIFSFGGSMELMAVPKRKTSPHKRGIRNGPKALKPTPVIVRCRGCGRVKLPHFYCCSGDRGNNAGDQNVSTR